jgi:hypothetical protein
MRNLIKQLKEGQEKRVSAAMQKPPRPAPKGRAPKMQQTKAKKPTMPGPNPKESKRGKATATAKVNGSAKASKRAWKASQASGLHHHMPEDRGVYVHSDVAEVLEGTDMYSFRRMAGLPLLEKKGPTMPDREQVSGEGNKSPIPRSLGTGAGDGAEKDIRTPENTLKKKKAAAKAKAAPEEEPEDEDEEEDEESSAEESFQGTFDEADILALAEEAMPLVNAPSKAQKISRASTPEQKEEAMLDLILNAPAITA